MQDLHKVMGIAVRGSLIGDGKKGIKTKENKKGGDQ
jgi:hypothetical protein